MVSFERITSVKVYLFIYFPNCISAEFLALQWLEHDLSPNMNSHVWEFGLYLSLFAVSL